MPNPSPTVEDLALSIRGMAVEDDFAANRSQPQVPTQAPPVHPQVRPPYGAYNNTFYSPTNRDSFGEYPYGYGPSEPSLYGSPALSNAVPTNMYPGMPAPNLHGPDLHRQQAGVFYDYGPARPPASQFFYPTQPVMFPPGPSTMVNPMLSATGPGGMEKKPV